MRVLALVAVLLVAPIQAFAAPRITPLSASDEVRQARPIAAVEALIFDVHTETDVPAQSVDDLRVTLALTFTLVESGNSNHLDDYALCRTYIWSPGEKTYQNFSCYALVAFKTIELPNRQMLAKIIGAGKGGSEAQVVHMAEAELGLEAQGSPRLKVSRTGETSEFRLDGAVAARVDGVSGTLNADEMARVRRYLARFVYLHPQVRTAVTSGSALPAVIESSAGVVRFGERRRSLRISNIRRVQVGYPLPPGMVSAQLVAKAETPKDIAVARAAATLAGQIPPPTVAAMGDQIQVAVAQGRDLDAFLLFLQASQARGRVEAEPLAAYLAPLRARPQSPDLAQFLEANRLAGDSRAKGDRESAARFLASDRMKTVPFGTFRYVTYANLITSADTKGWDPNIAAAMPKDLADNYWLHIAAAPWSSHAYKDVGNTYFAGFNVGDAWLAFDLGRAVDPNWEAGPMAPIAKYERALRTQLPELF